MKILAGLKSLDIGNNNLTWRSPLAVIVLVAFLRSSPSVLQQRVESTRYRWRTYHPNKYIYRRDINTFRRRMSQHTSIGNRKNGRTSGEVVEIAREWMPEQTEMKTSFVRLSGCWGTRNRSINRSSFFYLFFVLPPAPISWWFLVISILLASRYDSRLLSFESWPNWRWKSHRRFPSTRTSHSSTDIDYKLIFPLHWIFFLINICPTFVFHAIQQYFVNIMDRRRINIWE